MNRSSFRDNFAIINQIEIDNLKEKILDSGVDYLITSTDTYYVNLDKVCLEIIKLTKNKHE